MSRDSRRYWYNYNYVYYIMIILVSPNFAEDITKLKLTKYHNGLMNACRQLDLGPITTSPAWNSLSPYTLVTGRPLKEVDSIYYVQYAHHVSLFFSIMHTCMLICCF